MKIICNCGKEMESLTDYYICCKCKLSFWVEWEYMSDEEWEEELKKSEATE